MHKKAKIYTVDSEKDYLNLLKSYGIKEHLWDDKYRLSIDWNKFKEDYDAFHLTLDAFYELRMYSFESYNDILDISKIESGKMELSLAEYSLFQLLKDCYNMISPQMKEKHLKQELLVQ